MGYLLTVSKRELNPNFEAEIKQYSENRYRNMHHDDMRPQRETSTDALMVQLSDEQYEAVKKAVLATFE